MLSASTIILVTLFFVSLKYLCHSKYIVVNHTSDYTNMVRLGHDSVLLIRDNKLLNISNVTHLEHNPNDFTFSISLQRSRVVRDSCLLLYKFTIILSSS